MVKKMVVISVIFTCSLFANPYASCIGCHGLNGEKAALNGKSKVIKDMTKSEIKMAMQGYKDGTYGRALKNMMKAQAMKLSNADIDAIANKIGR